MTRDQRDRQQREHDNRVRRAVLDDLRMFMVTISGTSPLQVIDEYAALKGLNYETTRKPTPRFAEFRRAVVRPECAVDHAAVEALRASWIAQEWDTLLRPELRAAGYHRGRPLACGDCGEPFDSEKHQAQCLQP